MNLAIRTGVHTSIIEVELELEGARDESGHTCGDEEDGVGLGAPSSP